MSRILLGIIVGILGVAVLLIAGFTTNNFIRLDSLEKALDSKFPQNPPTGDYPDYADFVLAQAQNANNQSQQALNLASNLLGIFEAIGLTLTVAGVVITTFSQGRFDAATKDLEEARQIFEEEILNARQRFEVALEEREAELKALREELQLSAQRDRQRTSDALLATALIPLGERQYKTADYKGAVTTYQRALELDPNNPAINQRLGYVFIQSGEIDKAKEHYERAIEREQNFAPALAGLGYVYRRLGEKVRFEGLTPEQKDERIIERDQLLNRSEDLLLQALRLSPKLVDDDGESYWGILGGLYKRRGQIDQAIEAYEKVTDVTPQSSYGYGNLALLYQKTGERDKMLATYEIVEQIASKEAEAEAGNFWGYADLIVSSYAIGKADQAKLSLPIAISIAPQDSPWMLAGLTDTLRELVNFLDKSKIPDIQDGIKILEEEMARRAARE